MGQSESVEKEEQVQGSNCQSGTKLAKGFTCREIISGLSGPRFMTFVPGTSDENGCGTLLIAESKAGRISAFKDGKLTPFLTGLNDPTSVVVHGNSVFVGESDKISRFDMTPSGFSKRRLTNLPTGGNHFSRTVLVHRDKLYVSIGSTCNSCEETDDRRATVMQFNLDGTDGKIYASGLRNAVGLAINPWTQDIWVTNNARDNLGDDIPPDTVDILANRNFGFPLCNSGRIPNPELPQSVCDGIPKPVVEIKAHSAPLGLAFIDSSSEDAPNGFGNSLVISLHGSWNASVPTGYSVIVVPLTDEGNVFPPEAGFEPYYTLVQFPILSSISAAVSKVPLLGKIIPQARPVGVVVCKEGVLLSDDNRGVVYLISSSK